MICAPLRLLLFADSPPCPHSWHHTWRKRHLGGTKLNIWCLYWTIVIMKVYLGEQRPLADPPVDIYSSATPCRWLKKMSLLSPWTAPEKMISPCSLNPNILFRTQCKMEVRIWSGKTHISKWPKSGWNWWNMINIVHIYAKQCEIMQKNQWKGSNGQIHCFCKGNQLRGAKNLEN